MYELIFDSEAINFLEKCDKKIAKRIWNKLLSAKENPYHFFIRLVDRKDYKLRVGDYRIIADINEKSRRIQVTLIGHRRSIYKKLA